MSLLFDILVALNWCAFISTIFITFWVIYKWSIRRKNKNILYPQKYMTLGIGYHILVFVWITFLAVIGERGNYHIGKYSGTSNGLIFGLVVFGGFLSAIIPIIYWCRREIVIYEDKFTYTKIFSKKAIIEFSQIDTEKSYIKDVPPKKYVETGHTELIFILHNGKKYKVYLDGFVWDPTSAWGEILEISKKYSNFNDINSLPKNKKISKKDRTIQNITNKKSKKEKMETIVKKIK